MIAATIGYDGWLYKVLLLLHILTAIAGFGGVLLNGIYFNESQKRPGAPGRAVSEANYTVAMIAEKFIYAVPVLGVLMVLVSDGAVKFEEAWIWVSLVIYVAALGVSHSIIIPAHRRLNAALVSMEESGSDERTPEYLAAEKQLKSVAPILHLALVAILVLMIWQPG